MSASDELSTSFAQTHPEDAARVLERTMPEETAAFLVGVPIAAAAGLLRQMNVSISAASLSALEVKHAAGILERLPVSHAALVLRHLSPDARGALLESIGEKVARSLKRSLRFREGTAGALADPQVLTLPNDINVGDAQKHLRRLAAEALYNVYVTDRDHRLVGVVTIPTLLLTRPKQTLESIMQRQLIRLPASSDLAGIAGNPAWRDFDMLPVVDAADVFLGVIRHKTVRQLTGMRDTVPDFIVGIDLALSIADMYWRVLSGLATGLAIAASAQRDDGAHRNRR